MAWGFGVLILIPFIPFLNIMQLPLLSIVIAVTAGALALIAGIPYYYALSFEEVSRVAPLWQLSSVFVLFGAVFLLGESLKPAQYVAFVYIFVGAFLLAVKKTKHFFRITPALSFILLGGVIIAASNLLLKFGVASGNPLSIAFWIYAGYTLSMLLLLSVKYFRKRFCLEIKSLSVFGWGILLIMFVLGLGGTMILVLALQKGPVSMVYVISNTKAIFVLLYSTLLALWFPSLLKENTNRYVFYKKLSAIALIIVGVALLNL